MKTTRAPASAMLALALAPALVLLASAGPARAGNQTTTYAADGTKYTMRFGQTSNGPNGEILLLGEGETFVRKGVLASSRTAREVSSTSIALQTEGDDLVLQITPKTRFCANGRKVKSGRFKPGDVVVVTWSPDHRVASSIQPGPMAFAFSLSGAEPRFADCPK